MTKVQIDQASIILESVAFFFVSIDLYGRHRIAKLENRLKGINIFLFISQLVDWLTPKIKFKYKVLIIMTGLVLWDFTLVANNYKWTIHDNPGSMGYLVAASLAFFSVLIMLLFIVVVCVLFIVILTSMALIVIKTFTKLFPIEGLMLTLGAALFLASKVLAFYNCGLCATK